MPDTIQTQLININKIKMNPNNPRIVKDDKFKKLCNSIKEFPKMLEIRPIVVNEDMVVLGGNMRLKACKELKIKKIHIIKASELSQEQQQEFIIKDNIGYGEWEWDLLKNDWDINVLDNWGMDIPEDVFNIELEAKEDDFQIPDEINTDIVLGDLIEIGEHRLLCGDSTDSEQVAKLLNGVEPEWIFADAPYGMNAVSKSGVLSKNYKDILGDDNTEVAKNSFKLINLLFPKTKQVWWGANYYSSALPDSECWLVWDKNNGGSDQTDAELAWCNYRSVVRKFTKASEKTNRVHPTQKPVELVQWCYDCSKEKFNNVVDFFGGSGVSMVWAEQVNKKSFLMELDNKYCQVIIDRMLKLDSDLEVKVNGKQYKVKEMQDA